MQINARWHRLGWVAPVVCAVALLSVAPAGAAGEPRFRDGTLPALPPNTRPPVVLPFDPTGTVPVGILSSNNNREVRLRRSTVREAVAALFTARGKGENERGQKALTVPGSVEAYEEAQLFARIPGYVEKWTADIGDRVKKGQVLAVLSVPEHEAELAQKKALVVQAQAEVLQAQGLLKEATATLDLATNQIQEAEAGVKRARAYARYRKLTHERLKKLLESRSVSQDIVDEGTRQLEAAEAALAEAESKLRVTRAAREAGLAKRDAAEAGVQVARARFDVARANLQRVAVLLQYSRILAPFDGVVTRRSVNTGDLVTPSGRPAAPLFTVSRVDIIRVVVAVPDRDAPRLRVGSEATIKFDALPDKMFKGKVARIAGALDPAKRTLRAEIDLPNPDGKLLPGMYGTVTLMLGKD